MLFSILTTCFNKKPFLNDCINSVLNQTYKEWEWIIVDDLSDDGSYKKLSEIKDDRVKIIRNDNKLFCSGSYDKALKNASGVFCGILDADDALTKDALSTVVNAYANNKKIDFIYSQHYWCDQSLLSRKSGLSSLPPKKMSLSESSVKQQKHCFSHFRTFKRECQNKNILFPDGLKCSVDKYLGFALEECGCGGFLDRKLYYYRYYKGNMSLTCPQDQKKTWMKLSKDFYSNGKQKYPIVKI